MGRTWYESRTWVIANESKKGRVESGIYRGVIKSLFRCQTNVWATVSGVLRGALGKGAGHRYRRAIRGHCAIISSI